LICQGDELKSFSAGTRSDMVAIAETARLAWQKPAQNSNYGFGTVSLPDWASRVAETFHPLPELILASARSH
jgi:hypothetical protein